MTTPFVTVIESDETGATRYAIAITSDLEYWLTSYVSRDVAEKHADWINRYAEEWANAVKPE